MKVFSIVSSVVFLHILAFVLLVNGCSTRSSRTNHYRATHPYAENIGEPTSDRPSEPTESEIVEGEAIVLDEPKVADEPVKPAPAAEKKPAAKVEVNAQGEKVYVVKQGDSFWTIAKNNGTTISAICERNGVDRNTVLRAGKKLVIPAPSAKKSDTKKADKPSDPNAKIHVVKSGDALSKIARKYGVSTKAIMAANNLKNANNIRIGQKLTIPSKAAPAAEKKPAPAAPAKKAEPAKETVPAQEVVPAKEAVPAKEVAPVKEETVPAQEAAAPVETAPQETMIATEPTESVVD